MKTVLSVDGIAVVLLVSVGLISAVDAVHAHHHGDIIGRIKHKTKASSSSSSNTTTIDASLGPILAEPTIAVKSVSCLDDECNSMAAIFIPVSSSHVMSAPQQVQLRTIEPALAEPAPTPTRRRPHIRPTKLAAVAEGFSAPNETIDPQPLSEAEDFPQSVYEHGNEAELGSSLELHSLDLTPRALEARQDGSYLSVMLGPFPRPTSTSVAPAATAASVCPDGNGTTYTSAASIDYQIVCDIDFEGNDFPFQHVGDFEGCVQKCDAINWINHRVVCLAALYVPSRKGSTDDCYLKSSVSSPALSTLKIEGAIRLNEDTIASSSSVPAPTATNPASSAGVSSSVSNTTLSVASVPLSTSSEATSSIASPSTSTAITSTLAASSTLSTMTATSTSVGASTSAPPTGSEPGVTYASGSSLIVPKVANSRLHGPSRNTPSKQYINYEAPEGITLADSLLTVGVNGDLSTNYDLSLQTGVLNVNVSTEPYLSSLSGTPHLSRDGGHGGMVNGQHVFVFCDTGIYTTATESTNGKFLGFVGSSVAIDTGMNGLFSKPLDLLDGIGQWSDDVGRIRGFAPLTEGEQAYNQEMQGQGQRYAVWPQSSIIPLDGASGILYAPIVYDDVNRETKTAVFTYTGATLLTITAGGKGGPVAERNVNKIFYQDDGVEWGCAGGVRSWGASGIGGDDGSVYIFGNVKDGILLGRTSPAEIADRDSFEYWDGESWTKQMPTPSPKAFFIQGPFMDINLFYSPRHLTFIIVYLTVYADSTFYYRYLQTDQAILPPFAPGGDESSDYVENILKYPWSDEEVLYKAEKGLSGKYIYAGGVHEGYYGSNDIINGGSKMLLSWTAPTGEDPSSVNSEYQIVTAEVEWE